MEYNRFLEVDSREDLAGGPSVQHARTSGGQAVHSWWMKSHAMASDLSQEALAVVGLSWATKLWRTCGEIFSYLQPLATTGGLAYFACVLGSCVTKIFRVILVLYTRPGENWKRAMMLGVSSRTRNEEYVEDQMTRLIDKRVTESVGTEMAVLRAKIRQTE